MLSYAPITRRYAIEGRRDRMPFTGTIRVDGARARDARLRVTQTLRFYDGRVCEFEGTGGFCDGVLEARGVEERYGDRRESVLKMLPRQRRAEDGPLRDGLVQSLLRADGRGPAEADGHLCGDWSSEHELDPGKLGEIDRYFAKGERGSFVGVDGVRISHVTFRAEHELGALVISNGRSQSYRAYAELVHDLRRSGLTVYLLDHRGQGFSDRLIDPEAHPESPVYQRGHVDDFDHYVRDLETFIDQVVRPEEHARTFALGHSMGGGILTLYAQRNPGRLDAIVLSAPLHQLYEPWYLPLFLRGERTSYLSEWFLGPWTPSPTRSLELITTSLRRIEVANWIYTRFPEIRVGGPTVGWVLEAREATRRMREDAHRLVDPTLIVQGSGDRVVNPAGHHAIAERAERASVVVLEGALHDPIAGEDRHRHALLDLMLAFFDRHL